MATDFECVASNLNLRVAPSGAIAGELRRGDILRVAAASDKVWVECEVLSGVAVGQSGFVRRKWIVQWHPRTPERADAGRRIAASIVANRSAEFDEVRYGLGAKAKTWNELGGTGVVDCSGWVYLLGREIVEAYGIVEALKPSQLYTYSDQQITNVGRASGNIVSGRWLLPEHFLPGCVIGVDFSEYSWDRNRPLDIDHIVIVGADSHDAVFISQSSSSGGGVNRVPLEKWLASTQSLRQAGRVHLVDLLALSTSH